MIKRVLLVEDDEDANELLQEVLRRQSFDVRGAHDAEAAFEVLKGFVPDAALIDIGLGAVDGYQLAMQFRSLPTLADMWLIALTGHAGEPERRRALEAGFDLHLVKPVESRHLIETLRGLPLLREPSRAVPRR
jgi:DNA-binding response OmpR family regulator